MFWRVEFIEFLNSLLYVMGALAGSAKTPPVQAYITKILLDIALSTLAGVSVTLSTVWPLAHPVAALSVHGIVAFSDEHLGGQARQHPGECCGVSVRDARRRDAALRAKPFRNARRTIATFEPDHPVTGPLKFSGKN